MSMSEAKYVEKKYQEYYFRIPNGGIYSRYGESFVNGYANEIILQKPSQNCQNFYGKIENIERVKEAKCYIITTNKKKFLLFLQNCTLIPIQKRAKIQWIEKESRFMITLKKVKVGKEKATKYISTRYIKYYPKSNRVRISRPK